MAKRPTRKRSKWTGTKHARRSSSATRREGTSSRVRRSSSRIKKAPVKERSKSRDRDKRSRESLSSRGNTGRVKTGKIRGVSLTVKFSFWIGLTVAFFVLFFAGVLYVHVENNLDREKKYTGLYFCNALSPLAVTYLSVMKGAGVSETMKSVVEVKFKEVLNTKGVKNAAITQTTVGGTEEFLPGLGKGAEVARESEEKQLTIDGITYNNITLVEDGRMEDEKVFWFKKEDSAPVGTDGSKESFNVYVILSKKSIEESQRKLVVKIAGIGSIFVALGFLVAFLLASVVVKPIRQLVNDMAIVSSGNLAHRTTAHSKDEIGLLANTFNLMTKSLDEASEIEKEKLLIDSELNVASDIQARLLPEKTPQITGYQIGPFYRSAKDVGGDYYDFIPLDQDHLGIMVADVSGKGIIGSLVMSITRTVLRLVSQKNFSAADTLSKTNRVLAQDIRRGMFVTAFYCILNARNREIVFSSAGHNPMVLYRSAKRKVELANPKGIALGFNKGPIFDKTVKEERLQLDSGDMIILYTDGVVEAMDEHNREYGEKRFYKFVLEHARNPAEEFISNLVTDIDAHRGNAVQSDDITVVALKVE